MPTDRFARPLLPYLRSVVGEAASSTVQSEELRSALDTLMSAARPEAREAMETISNRFWRAAGEPLPSVRTTWLRAVLKTIEAQFPAMPDPLVDEW